MPGAIVRVNAYKCAKFQLPSSISYGVDPEIDRVDRTSLKSSQSTFNTYEVNEIGSVYHLQCHYSSRC